MHALRWVAMMGAAVAVSMSPLAASASPVGSPFGDDECRMFEEKPGYECRAGTWQHDYAPPREGKACSIGDTAPGLRCRGGRWQDRSTGIPETGEKCTAVGAQRVGIGGMLTCTHGPFGFTWQ
ncbi:Secreted protein OS=Tsukamurella paurometabola (strain ATCC 8368 / DSM / CCUG 35730 / CIP 100753/ JCM 10117 / KCTC 9821 / NBRC 16120 / NCIMB 702349 / NCTC 13040) OX=521096 GN=Tpau_0532 PE=4 SV=1 [Tsukamurella paurometabola]|uniref:Secreted protein n=1 Tax=Tsukamurella paurometabola (strain ATCC 8368 / DSM 20162 / CCUG 35730 / CIP 100753 / JCM 10117 / KCTC 9821 / NBRC 16120 / NCIMB 702349 / NCTC 13040) TaxID=521096 RepID=D5USA6_TSUPD|nr:hypothetical protein [Tsukamurella paurometabola]ADG77173.1 hypothetical protein Tpau_0532 [Tsukamurella paurometabola DSM 20162]SUP43050.1 Uncharacterised protein [Tsukamurella paurometabola]